MVVMSLFFPPSLPPPSSNMEQDVQLLRCTTPLPPLPPRMRALASNPSIGAKLSSFSRKLNNLFCFSAIGVTGGFQKFEDGISSVTITGRTYHRLLDAASPEHSIHWFLYDELERERDGRTQHVPNPWIQAVKANLDEVNPYVHHLQAFRWHCSDEPSVLQLSNFSINGDFAAVVLTENLANLRTRDISILSRSFPESNGWLGRRFITFR